MHGKGATVVLMKSGADCIAGGYTSVPWSALANEEQKRDDEALLFSVTHLKKYPVVEKENAVRHYKDWGPVFGGSKGFWNLGFGHGSYKRSNTHYKGAHVNGW